VPSRTDANFLGFFAAGEGLSSPPLRPKKEGLLNESKAAEGVRRWLQEKKVGTLPFPTLEDGSEPTRTEGFHMWLLLQSGWSMLT
jgi:hypothetical protein